MLVFFDDILVYSKGWEEHLSHLKLLFETLGKHQLYAKQSKCKFASQRVEYLGHVISRNGIAVDPKKISAILEWPLPKTPKALRGFLGLTRYYRKFVKGYGGVAAPLNAMLKKGGFQWTKEAMQSFEDLKQGLISPPVLRIPNFTQDFTIECDASGTRIGAVLLQEYHPIAYASKGLKGKALLLSTYEKELLAILWAVKKWKQYLLGRRFTIKTDQRSIKFLLDQRVREESQHSWLQKLNGYDYLVEYKKGKENIVAMLCHEERKIRIH